MKNISSDTDYSDENDQYDEGPISSSSENIDVPQLKEEQDDGANAKTDESQPDKDENVAEKVEGVNIIEGHHGTSTSTSLHNNYGQDTTSADPMDELIIEWETDHKITLSPTYKKIARYATEINIVKGRGITVQDLVEKGFSKHNAEKLLPKAVRLGLLMPLDNRRGKQMQYAMANCIHVIMSKENERKKNDEEILPIDVSLILVRELSSMKYAYHNIRLETALTYREDYKLFNWPVPSPSNNQKVQTFSLEPKRSCTFILSPTGTVNIAIECTYHPYEFHTPSGLMRFIGACGQIMTLLQIATKNRTNVVPWFGDWYLRRFDYNKDIPTKVLKNKYDANPISWSSKGLLKVEYLGTIFQIYCKDMPYKGECLRNEGHFTTKEKVKMKNMLVDIAAATADGDGTHPFTTIEEMLLKKSSKDIKAPSVIGG